MKNRLLLSLLSGVLLGVSWVEITNFFPLIFIALVPLIWVENQVFSRKYRPIKVYTNAYVTFFVFNLITTWWIYHASLEGGIMAVVCNSALMAIPIWLFHLTRKYIGNKEGYFAFIFYWMGFEWGHFRWELSWPWLSYGNVFANSPNIVQWYEYTGVGGGTLWVLIINFLLFKIVNDAFLLKKSWAKQKIKITILASILTLPILCSYLILSGVNNGDNNEKITVVLSQPNIDPYQKFDFLSSGLDQVNTFLNVTKPNMNSKVDLVIAPETAVPFSLVENNLQHADEILLMRNYLFQYPNASILAGISSRKFFEKPISKASKPTSDGLGFYENYNTALLLNVKGEMDIYHKSELVLGVERLPLSFILKYIESAFDLGGTTGTLGVSKEAKVFKVKNAKIAPTICYESIYGNTVGKFSAKGANIIAIITNDAWWYDTPGYKQLLAYARLRAIENRKWIARSANTGISCFISPKGEITKRTKWEETTSLKSKVPLIEGQTFYIKHGDYLGRLSMFIGVLLLFMTIAKRFRRNVI